MKELGDSSKASPFRRTSPHALMYTRQSIRWETVSYLGFPSDVCCFFFNFAAGSNPSFPTLDSVTLNPLIIEGMS